MRLFLLHGTSQRLRNLSLLLIIFVNYRYVATKDLNLVVYAMDDVGCSTNEKKYSYNYHRDHGGKGMTSPTFRLMDNHNSDDDITTSIMNSDSSIRSTILLRNHDRIDDDSRRTSKCLIHNDEFGVNDDDDTNLLFRYRKKKHHHHHHDHTELSSFGLLLSSSSSPRLTKPVDLAWRCEPPNIILPHNDDNHKNDVDATVSQYPTHLTKTGTTIVGMSGNGYCILGADSRATSGTMVADKYCSKLHPLSHNCAAAGAGTSADLDHITRECFYQTQLWLSSPTSSSSRRFQTVGNHPVTINTTSSMTMLPHISVPQICRYLQQRLYEQQGTCQANLIVGGMDSATTDGNGERRGILRAIHPHGSIDVVSYTALGSGSYAAISVLESAIHNSNDGLLYPQHNFTMDEAIALVVKAVKAGIDHDLGSGSQVDLCIITSDGVANYTRCYVPEETYDSPTTICHSDNVTMNVTSTIMKHDQPNRNNRSFQNVGINGFGNVPYVVRSRSVQRHPMNSNDEHDQYDQTRLDRWKDILPQ